jgi:hypothetical protein
MSLRMTLSTAMVIFDFCSGSCSVFADVKDNLGLVYTDSDKLFDFAMSQLDRRRATSIADDFITRIDAALKQNRNDFQPYLY